MGLNRPQLSVPAGAPLPRQTGHGDFPHPAFAHVVSSRKHSQTHQSQMVQMRIETDALASTPAPLTATAQMSPQSISHEVIEVPKRLPRIAQAEILRPARQMTIQSPDQVRQRCVTLLRIDQTPQRVPFPRHRFARGLQVPVAPGPTLQVSVLPKGVPQKIQALAQSAGPSARSNTWSNRCRPATDSGPHLAACRGHCVALSAVCPPWAVPPPALGATA